jgi:putative holliday junction resolvase
MTEGRSSGRVLALDVGARRTGLALSDPTGTLATPFGVITSRTPLREIVGTIERLRHESDGLAAVVVGRPVRLDGTPDEQTSRVDALVSALRNRAGLPVLLQDERLTSVEAESRLAEQEKDWRARKAKLDAAAAAVILQEYLDRQRA